jgi:hypothetical protein
MLRDAGMTVITAVLEDEAMPDLDPYLTKS